MTLPVIHSYSSRELIIEELCSQEYFQMTEQGDYNGKSNSYMHQK